MSVQDTSDRRREFSHVQSYRTNDLSNISYSILRSHFKLTVNLLVTFSSSTSLVSCQRYFFRLSAFPDVSYAILNSNFNDGASNFAVSIRDIHNVKRFLVCLNYLLLYFEVEEHLRIGYDRNKKEIT